MAGNGHLPPGAIDLNSVNGLASRLAELYAAVDITVGQGLAMLGTEIYIPNGGVTSAMIADGTIATGDLADNAVTSAKIADGTIATGDLADSAVTSAKIAD